MNISNRMNPIALEKDHYNEGKAKQKGKEKQNSIKENRRKLFKIAF